MAPLGDEPLGDATLGDLVLGDGGTPPALDVSYSLTIGPRTDCLQYVLNGWQIEEELNGRNLLRLPLVTHDGYIPTRGSRVVLTRGSRRLFAGFVWEVNTTSITQRFDGWLRSDVDCVDFNSLADRRIIGEVYVNQTLGSIVRDLVRQTLAAEGISDAGVQDGPLITAAVFPNITIAEALNRLSESTGYYWDIDYESVLHVFPRQLELAPFAIDSAASPVVINTFSHRQSLSEYRNIQLIDGGSAVTLPRTETIQADGTGRTYVTEYPIHAVPSLFINAVPVDPLTVGIRGIDEDKTWYWNKGQNTIGRDSGLPPLPSTDQLSVTYIGEYRIILQALDAAGITERRNAEGTSGFYEHVQVDQSLDNEDVVQSKGLALLNKFRLGSDLSVTVFREGLRPGQQILVTLSDLGLSAVPYLITRVTCQHQFTMELGTVQSDLRAWNVEMTTGELHGTFLDFWRTVYKRNPIALDPNAVVRSLLADQEAAAVGIVTTATLDNYAERDWGVSDWGRDEWANP
jgi:hypothetical protein